MRYTASAYTAALLVCGCGVAGTDTPSSLFFWLGDGSVDAAGPCVVRHGELSRVCPEESGPTDAAVDSTDEGPVSIDADPPPPLTDAELVEVGLQRVDGCAAGWPHREPSCTTPQLAWDAASIQCSIAGGTLSLSGDVCDPCGQVGPTYLDETTLYFVPCGSCTAMNSEGYLYRDRAFAANACQSGELIAGQPLGRELSTLTGAGCIDVYALASSSASPTCDPVCQMKEETGIHACRCDLSSGTCSTCAGGNCP